ncbi:TPA: hypothetical protein I7290_24455 [Vibrio parahaemolyticus]|nr:hypothetical protein [Vibrio parahaemolyticus]
MKLDVRKKQEAALKKMNESLDSTLFLSYAVKEYCGNIREGRSDVSGLDVTSAITFTTRTNDELIEYLNDVVSTTYLEQVFQSLFNVFEASLFDILTIYLKSNLSLLNPERTITSSTIVDAGNYENVITELIHNELNKAAYGSVHKWMKQVSQYLKYQIISHSDLETLAEMKATRNLLVHAEGICNKIYVEASSGSARFKLGERVSIDYGYLIYTHRILCGILDKVLKAIESKN